MTSESSYDQFNDLSHKRLHHHSPYNNNQKQLQMFTSSPSTENVLSTISGIPSRQQPSYSILLDPSSALIMKPKVTLTTASSQNCSQSCLPTITGKMDKMSQNFEEPKLMTLTEVSSVGRRKRSQRKHYPSSVSPWPSLSSHYSTSSTQCLPSLPIPMFHPSDSRNRCSRSMFTSCKVLLVVLLCYSIQSCSCECEKQFDAVFCDLPESYSNGAKSSSSSSSSNGNYRNSHSNVYEEEQAAALSSFLSTSVTSGYGFKSGKIWDLECVSSDEINVLKNSMKPFDLPHKHRHGHSNILTAAISDGETYYLIQNNVVYASLNGSKQGVLSALNNEPKAAWEVFDDYSSPIRTAFHYGSKMYVFDGKEFHIYTQKIMRKTGPFWSWRRSDDHKYRLRIPPRPKNSTNGVDIGNITSVFTVKSADHVNQIDIVLVYGHVEYYKMSLDQCLMNNQGMEFLHENCFWPKGTNKVDHLFDCIWISWQVLAAIITVCLVSLLVIGYCCFCIICYRKKRRSGTFRHEKQSCCPDSDHSDCCDDGTEHEPLKTSLSMVDQVGNGDVCGGKICRDGLSLLPGGPIHPSINAATAPVAVNGNGGLSNGSLHHHHHHHIIECGEKDALFNPDLDMESETGSTVGVSCYNEDRLSINLEESKFGKYGPSNNGCVYNSTTTTSQSNLTKTSTTQYHHHHVNVSNGGAPIIKHNGI